MKTMMLTDRDVNLLRSCASWLSSRSSFKIFENHEHLMKEYATQLDVIANKIEPCAVEDPVTMEELFGNRKKP